VLLIFSSSFLFFFSLMAAPKRSYYQHSTFIIFPLVLPFPSASLLVWNMKRKAPAIPRLTQRSDPETKISNPAATVKEV